MTSAIILGPTGRFGRAAQAAFAARGWHVSTFGRHATEGNHHQGDVKDVAALSAACAGHDVIVNAINPPYPAWKKELPPITQSVIAAARETGARVTIPGNVYNYGAGMPPVLTEQTPWQPTTRKGRLRVEMEESYRASGVKTLVLRGGDFLEQTRSGNWFDSHIAPKVWQGKVMYPGPMDLPHAWAYLPDMARAAVHLLEEEDRLDRFQEVGFPGLTLTGAELVAQIEAATGVPQKVKGFPWPLLGALGLVMPLMREVHEMRYLWQVPHGIDGSLMAQLIPGFTPTPRAETIAAALPPRP